MAESEMDSLQLRVLRRAQELNRLKAGKASETISFQEKELGPRNSDPILIPNMEQGHTSRGHLDSVPPEPERGAVAVGGNGSDHQQQSVWSTLTKMEDRIRKSEEQQADILSNVVLTVAKLQKTMEGQSKSSGESTQVVDIESEDDTSIGDDIDQLFETETESKTFLSDLEDSYKESVKYGAAVSEKLANLVSGAIDRPLNEEAIKQLEEKYRIPENCQKMSVPKVNRELWHAFKPSRPADLAMQLCQKYMSMAMVSVVKTLEVLMSGGDTEQIKTLSKDTFRILAQGVHINSRKRRELIRPSVPAKYRKVCDTDQKASEYLFGENLDQRVDDIEKKERRSKKLSGQHTTVPKLFLGQRFPQGNRYVDQRSSLRPQQQRAPEKRGYQRYQGKPQPKGQIRKK